MWLCTNFKVEFLWHLKGSKTILQGIEQRSRFSYSGREFIKRLNVLVVYFSVNARIKLSEVFNHWNEYQMIDLAYLWLLLVCRSVSKISSGRWILIRRTRLSNEQLYSLGVSQTKFSTSGSMEHFIEIATLNILILQILFNVIP